MPRIDPLQLLRCLSVLLDSNGGILSREEVPRLVNLMTKFSKKLVSKCVYILILKNTDAALVDMFMATGGWLLIHTWLVEAMSNSNWNLVSEILELLLVTPVDASRLRLNTIPKLVKTLSKRDDLGGVKDMALTLVENWLAIVKTANAIQEPAIEKLEQKIEENMEVEVAPTAVEEKMEPKDEIKAEPMKVDVEMKEEQVTNEIETVELQEAPPMEEEVPIESTKMQVDENDDSISTGMFYKITVRDGKQVITKLSNEEKDPKEEIVEKKKEEKTKDDEKSKSNSSSKDKSRSSSSSKSSSKSSSSSSKDKSRSSSSSSSHSKSSSKDKDRDKHRSSSSSRKDKDSHRSNSSKRSSSSSKSSSKSDSKKDSKQSEKDKDTLAKLKPQSIDKLGRIPRKPAADDQATETKKPSISIEVRKKTEERPKTVKIFNSKMRSTGLEEEVKPPPPRNATKRTPPPVVPPVPVKRSSPPKDITSSQPLEKKIKIDIPERPGAIKLIPPKPKPSVLQESDIFMDAINAATTKKETKKKKRRTSVSATENVENSPVAQQSPTPSSPIGLKNFSPANFYQDTLTSESKDEDKEDKKEESDEEKAVEEEKPEKEEIEKIEVIEEPKKLNNQGLKSALTLIKKKGPKRSIRWKEEDQLVDIRYFELDETERVNVSRMSGNFNDLAKMDMCNEREALLSRKLTNEDLMEPTTLWRIPILVDQPDLPVEPGSKSLEKDIQYAREKNVLQAIYFSKNMIPDTPGEPMPEIHPIVDPVMIPLEDAEGQEYDLRSTPWPEPKGMAPDAPPINVPPLFPNIGGNMPPFNNFNPMGPQNFPPNMPGGPFCPPNMMNGPPNMMNGPNMNMMGPNQGPFPGRPMDLMNAGPMNQGPMNPNMFGPNGPMDNFNPMMNEPNNFPMGFNGPNNMNMFGPTNNFNMNRGGGRGNFRGRGHHNNWGRNNPVNNNNNWNRNNQGPRGGRICKNIKNHGFCRNIENCAFLHPN